MNDNEIKMDITREALEKLYSENEYMTQQVDTLRRINNMLIKNRENAEKGFSQVMDLKRELQNKLAFWKLQAIIGYAAMTAQLILALWATS